MFSCKSLSRFGAVRDVAFDVRRGEILGCAGLVGVGRTEAMRALINADDRSSGRFWLQGDEIQIHDPASALAKGIIYLSEDRKGSGLFLSYSIAENIGASTLDRYADRFGVFHFSALRQRSREFIKRMDIRPPDETARVINLSGGNQQKVLISKALDVNPKLLIFDEPTRGVDVGAKSLIHARLRELAESGVGVVVISSEMPEVIGLSDRILVFRNGGVSAELDNRKGEVSQESIITMPSITEASDECGSAQTLENVIVVQYIGLVAVTLLILFGFQATFGNVLTGPNLEVLAMNMVFEGIMALGMTFVIITGGIDISVASVFAFAEILVSKLMVEAGFPIVPAIIVTLIAVAAIGALNGLLIVLFRVHPLIITMGTLLTLRGVNLAITDGHSVSGFSDDFLFLGQGKILGINAPILFFAIAAIILGDLLAHHRFFASSISSAAASAPRDCRASTSAG